MLLNIRGAVSFALRRTLFDVWDEIRFEMIIDYRLGLIGLD